MADTLIFNLYLSPNSPYNVANADLANTRFLINWDTFFSRENYRYRSCRIRHKFLAEPSSSATYNYNPATFSGLILANGLPPVASNPYGGTIIGIIGVEAVQYLSAGTATQTTVLTADDTTGNGSQNILVPTGMKELNIQLWDNLFGSSSSKLLSAADSNIPLGQWNLLLVFELSDRIEE